MPNFWEFDLFPSCPKTQTLSEKGLLIRLNFWTGWGFVPIVSGVPGFVAYYVVSEGDGAVISINIFEDKAGADESTRRAADWVRENLAFLLPNAPEVAAGEVIVQVQKVG